MTVHNHDLDPMCAERHVDGYLLGACMRGGELEVVRDPETIRNLLDADWTDQYIPVTRRLSPREMWIDVHADHPLKEQA